MIPLDHAIASDRARSALDTSITIDAGRRREAEQAAAARLSQKALMGTPLRDLLDDVTATLADTLGIEQSAVLLFADDEPAALKLVAAHGELTDHVGTLRVPTLSSIAGQALARREPVVCHTGVDGYRYPGSRHLFGSGVESSLVVAMDGPDHALGAVGVYSRSRREFTRDDELFVQTVANVVGTALVRDRAQAALVEAEEAERRRIAEAVHDDTLQVMIAVALSLETLERETLDPTQRARLHELVRDTREAAGRLRSLAFDLFPEDLGAGLEVALRTLVGGIAAGAGLEAALEVALDHPVPTAAARTIFRNTQEALVNVRKHARAGHVRVVARTEGAGTLVQVVDDGIGISTAAVAGVPGHLGIRGLHDRTGRAGGHVRIAPGPGGGTTVTFWVPDQVGAAGHR